MHENFLESQTSLVDNCVFSQHANCAGFVARYDLHIVSAPLVTSLFIRVAAQKRHRREIGFALRHLLCQLASSWKRRFCSSALHVVVGGEWRCAAGTGRWNERWLLGVRAEPALQHFACGWRWMPTCCPVRVGFEQFYFSKVLWLSVAPSL